MSTQADSEDSEPLRLLRGLVHLRDAGVVSPDEFQEKSTALLERL